MIPIEHKLIKSANLIHLLRYIFFAPNIRKSRFTGKRIGIFRSLPGWPNALRLTLPRSKIET